MRTLALTSSPMQALARAGRAQIEAALDRAGWPWSPRLSLWLDGLLTIEEGQA